MPFDHYGNRIQRGSRVFVTSEDKVGKVLDFAQTVDGMTVQVEFSRSSKWYDVKYISRADVANGVICAADGTIKGTIKG